ncbi:MAG: hypothetical protein RR324_04525 [Cellulosilyticaceae bacterium]
MGELDRLGCMLGNNWIWIVVAFLLLSNTCILPNILEQLSCLFSNFGVSNALVWIVILFVICKKDMFC